MIEDGDSVHAGCCHFCDNGKQYNIAAETGDGLESVHDTAINHLKSQVWL